MYTYLALGDSYTIGESVPVYESFPYQLVQILRIAGYEFNAPEIVAKTGWTTDELMTGIKSTRLLREYDIVTLLIGVNNQYRGRDLAEYREHFSELLNHAMRLAGEVTRVFVVSIPDWGATPFAEGRDRNQIATAIDEFNQVNREISMREGAQYIDITGGTREAVNDETLLAADKLHPSGKEYMRWATSISSMIINTLKK